MEGKRQQLLLAPHIRPKLNAKARIQIDNVTGESVLLYPEGVLLLNTTGAAIIELCDGQHSFSEISTELSRRYNAAPASLQQDISEYLMLIQQHALLEFVS
ncbi:MAG TPA: pyrroloquinoline quinone biosynthesis peptide chaperone PqqD [Dictyobacter sp.]|jgi:pyrroloquinoline quinone biosynthesis protein D|nr:pyrroloquinoline quinone biosynthesis peptide chaperone PqqD [Dictyobacter sp.]